MQKTVMSFLKSIGENPCREGLRRSPKRVEETFRFLTQGYRDDPEEIARGAIFSEAYSGLIEIKDIEFYSLCEHHLLPFWGKIHVKYIPNGKIIGISKIPRIINAFARRLQIQERLTEQITNTLESLLTPKGISVVIEAIHFCILMRGIQKQNSKMVTSTSRGTFAETDKQRGSFYPFY